MLKADYEDIGSRIKYHRTRIGLSQEELADRTNLSRVHISYIERGERIPSLESIINISNSLNVSVDELLPPGILVSESSGNSKFTEHLLDCSQEENEILTESVLALKEILRRYKITK